MSAVRVDEVRLALYGAPGAEDWWAHFRLANPPSRFTHLRASVAGAVVDVACDDAGHAEWLAAELVERGVPKAAVRVLP